MRPIGRVLGTALAAAMLCACDGGGGTEAEPLPEPFISATLSGAIADSVYGVPRIALYGFVVDDYSFDLFADVTKGWYQYIHIWGEGPRPRVGTYVLTPWKQGQAGTRMHATFSRDLPRGPAMYQAVSGTVRITRSGPEGIAGEFTFRGAPGYLMPDSAVFFAGEPEIGVQGSFSARCDPQLTLCR